MQIRPALNAMTEVLHRCRCHAVFAMLFVILASGCASLPDNTNRTPSLTLVHTDDTLLGKAVAERSAANPGKNGIFALAGGHDAFAMRMALAAFAQRSIDLQYYIWKSDTTGQLMFEQVWNAAERGVRIRLLLDDQQTRGLDMTLAALDGHPNIEVRLFNPYATRFRVGDIVVDFNRINRRMHNKSFTVDNQMAIVGGRNIGNEYYGADPGLDYSDLDVAVVGPVVREVSHQFDLYWNSTPAYPASAIVGAVNTADGEAHLRNDWDKVREDPEAQQYVKVVRDSMLLKQLRERTLPLEWTHARIVYDRPEKVLQPPENVETHLLPRMEEAMGKPMRELDLVSPYFVPGKDGAQGLDALCKRGVRVRVLTNALAATDVAPVHAGYKKYRVELLRSGVALYELKPSAITLERKADKSNEQQRIGGSSSAALHAKTFAVDQRRLFVGSFNVDPRSVRLNTEMGVVMDSSVLASKLSEALDRRIPEEAYQVRLAADGRNLEWIEVTAEGEKIYTNEPQTGLLRRIWVGFLSILPIEGLL